MTPAEAIAALEAADPTKAFCVGSDHWTYMQLGQRIRYEKHRVSMQPARNGEPCEIFYGESLEVAVTQTQRAIEKVAAQMEEGK